MTKLFEIKEKILRFVSEYGTYLKYVYKFVVALILFGMINGTIGFLEEISTFPTVLFLAVICCLLPQGATLFVAAALVLLHLSVLSPEVTLIVLLIFGIMYFLYFRFAPHDTALFTITPIFCAMGIPYILPISTGLLRKGYSVTALVCGTIAFYFVDGIYDNVKNLQATIAGGGIESTKMVITVGQLLENQELYLTVAVFIVTTLVVYAIRRTSMQYAWKIAVIVGVLIQVSGFLVGYILFDITEKMLGMLVGSVLAVLVGFAIEFLCMDLNYARTERVQFEDDEYYYYVKAIPKKMVASSDKTITEFNGIPGFAMRMKAKKEAEEMVLRKNIADELEIDEELLK